MGNSQHKNKQRKSVKPQKGKEEKENGSTSVSVTVATVHLCTL